MHNNVYVHPEWRAGAFGGSVGMCVQDVGENTKAMWGEEWKGNTCKANACTYHSTLFFMVLFI